MKKILALTESLIVVAIALWGCYEIRELMHSTNNLYSTLAVRNVEALANGDDASYRYPEKKGKAQFCKIYVYTKAGVIIGKYDEPVSKYEASTEYERTIIEGLKDKCPDNGHGCNPYSCQQVAY